MREALCYEPLGDGRVQCHVCARRCVISEGKTGFCRVRKNENGKLYSLNYCKLIAMNVDPIEKKPHFHFNPGSSVFSIATVSCNFRCRYCDNYELSQILHEGGEIRGRYIPPERIVKLAKDYGCQGISETYSEPTIFIETCYDVNKIAHDEGLFCTWVTNGYLTPETVKMIAPYLDCAVVDFKGGGNPRFYRKLIDVPVVEPIYECLKTMKAEGIYTEITNLVVTKYGEDPDDIRALASWIRDNLGRETTFHLLRFHPDYKLLDVASTPVPTLEKLREIAMEYLDYVLIGNVPGHPGENTYCPKCGNVVINRFSFSIVGWKLEERDGKHYCKFCGHPIPVVGKYWPGGTGFPLAIL